MSLRLLNSALKCRASTLSINYGCMPRLIRVIALQNTCYVRVQLRHFSRELKPDSQSSAGTPSVATTIVTELQKANVRCTKIGIEILEEIYAEYTCSEVLAYDQSYDLWDIMAVAAVGNPNSLSAFDLNTSKVRQWRSEDALDLWLDYKTYKLWEALYKNSTIFKDMIDYEEQDFVNFHRPSITSQELWIWMTRIIREGIVDREDVDNLPEVMFRDIVIGSGELAEKLASKPAAIRAGQEF
ncbi:hypothetical protein TWF730_001850 [Orbilia blumenaviensis]|uniref:Uncharacterized protein n=1 Tax=Orbilia blumenaviensis TaxID=1796055 RepID=A0AAV9UEI8_9PEZI